VCYPALLLALALTCVAIPLNDWLIPYCSLLKERELRALFIKEPFRISMLTGQVTTKIGGYMIYFESAERDVLHNVVVIEPREREHAPAAKPAKGAKRKATPPAQDRDESAEVNVYRAQRAHYSVDEQKRKIRIVLHEAQCIIVTPEKTARVWFELTADEQVKDIPMFEAEVSFEKRNQQTTQQLLLRARELEAELRTASAKATRHRLRRDLARMLTDVRFREALAFSTLALCFVGVPLGIWMRRQSRLASFAAAVLVFLLLYGMIAGGEGLATDGRLAPRVALWTPDILTGSVGLGMLLHLFRR